MSDGRNYWGREEEEVLTNTDPDEAIEEILDAYGPGELEDHEVTVIEYRTRECVVDAESILESALERLDEEYGNPDGDYTKPTAAMLAAADAFVAAVLADYRAWSCEPTGNKVEVNALEWVKANRPDWLVDGAADTTGARHD